MVVARFAVDDFLNRPVRNSDKVKLFSSNALDKKIFELIPTPHFTTQPYLHQKACFLLGLKYPAYLFLLYMGLGKTKLILDLFSYRQRTEKLKRLLVLVPNISNIETWREQVEIHAPHLSFAGISGNREERASLILGASEVCVATYMGWLHLVCDNKNNKMVINEKQAKKYSQLFDQVVLDESSSFRKRKSLTYRACRRFIKYVPYRYCLTGTPFGRNPEDLWTQFYIIDSGQTLGETLGLFRAAFFTEKDDFWSGGKKYIFDKKKQKQLYDKMRNVSISYSEEECPDLPAKTYSIRPIIFSEETWAYYDKLVEELREAKGNFQLLKNTFIRMRQLASGFLAVQDPEGERIEVVFKENPKLEATIDLLHEIPFNRKVVIFNEFQKSGDILCARLKQERMPHVRLFGKTKNKAEVQHRFKETDKYRIMVSSSAGAYGGNWQVANYVVFYESPTCPILRTQMEKRVHRQGQNRAVFYFDLPVKGSVEEKILKYLKEGKDLFKILVEGKFNV